MAEHADNGALEPLDASATRRLSGPLQVAFRHKVLVLIGVVSALVVGALFYSQSKPIYQSSGRILVVKKQSEFQLPGSEVGRGYQADFLATHVELIRSPIIIEKAVVDGNLGELESFAGQGDPSGAIIGQLRVTKDRENTNLLTLTFRGPFPNDCATVLKAILKSYEHFLDNNYRNISEETVEIVKKFKEELDKKLEDQDKKLRTFRIENLGLLKGKDGTSVLIDRLNNLETKKHNLQLRQWDLETRIAAFIKAQKNGRSRADLLLMVSESTKKLAGDPVRTTLKEDAVFELQLQELALRELYESDHPQLKALLRKMEMLDAKTKQLGNDQAAPIDPVDAHVRFLQQALEDSKFEETFLDKLIVEEKIKAKELTKVEVEEEDLKKHISRRENLLASIGKRLDEINFVKDLIGFKATVIARPTRGGQVAPRANMIMGLSLFLGLLCGLGLAYGAEITDHSFRTPEEIRRQLGLAVVGHIPFFANATAAELTESQQGALQFDPMLTAFFRPKSREAESYRGVRTGLFFSARKHGYKVVQVTSPDMGDGKTTLAANLAISIAQSGKSIILIDADFRRPQVHKLFGASNDRGLACAVLGEAELADVIQTTVVPNLSIIPCGPHPTNPAELLNQPRLKELLDYLRDRYDFVIVDTPPLLAVTDPCVVVPHVDGVFLTIRLGKNARPHAQRAKEILSTLGANVFGVVVNDTDRDSSAGYGYGSYQYGYGYAYQYSNYESNDSDAQAPANGDPKGQGQRERPGRRKENKKGVLQRFWERL